jgi:hypothetical protein
MIETDSNHCRIVRESIDGEREVDEQTFTSLSVLSERLERLKNCNKTFSHVSFSPSVKKLKIQRNAVAV